MKKKQLQNLPKFDKSSKKALGRGLSALIGESNVNSKNKVQQLDLAQVQAGVYQPRKNFSDESLKDLSVSIKENGVLQPIIVRKSAENNYEIIAGERRFRASKLLKLSTIPAIIVDIDNVKALELAIVENVQREDLSAIEEAIGYQRLMQEFSYTQEKLAESIGKSRSHIANILRLLALPDEVQNMLADNLISIGHAKAIIAHQDPLAICKQIIAQKLSVREVEKISQEQKTQNKAANQNKNIKNKISPEDIQEITEKLEFKTGLKTNISQSGYSGKLTINYSNLDELKDFLDLLQLDYKL